ncbi:MAG TPA: hypothetical protein VEC56_02815 [Candidatus Krumholzibacteria bacterium]|nr:hypothetical protein [Candidatus Krumholzibacteria bacterium]
MNRLVFLAVALLVAVPSRAEVLHGTATLEFWSSCGLYWGGNAIDFESQSTVGYYVLEADLSLSEPVNYCGRLNLWFSNGGHGAQVGGSLEELTTAPEPLGQWVMIMPPVDEACVLKTVGGLYVKFAVRALRMGAREVDIEYYVQTDGTPEFGPVLPVTATTWGQIKALYR